MEKNNLQKKARLLYLNSLALAQEMKSGAFKSLYRGQGMEFQKVREYFQGDDIRALDWNVTARMAKPFVKVFEEERELNIFIILDSSLSMQTSSARNSRLKTVIECASLVTLSSNHNSSPVGAVIFDKTIQFSCAPKRGMEHVMFLLSHFEKAGGKEAGSCLDNALRGAIKLLRKKSLVMIFSDFRTCAWQIPFATLCKKNDVVAIKITDPLDDILPSLGGIPFCDLESNQVRVLPTSSSNFLQAWREENTKRTMAWKHECIRRGGIPIEISTVQDASAQLIKFFSAREKMP